MHTLLLPVIVGSTGGKTGTTLLAIASPFMQVLTTAK
jgi:hypothetical protein